MTGAEQSALRSVREQERRNIVDLLSERAPRTIGWLQVPLTPSRAAAIAAFEAKHGIKVVEVTLDVLDDIIFDTGRSGTRGGQSSPDRPDTRTVGEAARASEFASGGSVPCMELTSGGSGKPAKSNAISCGAPQEFADHPISARHGRGYSPSSPPNLSPISLAAASEPPNTSSPASTIPPHSQSAPSSTSAFRHGNGGS